VRAVIRESMGVKEQMRFLGFVDTIDQQVSRDDIQAEVVTQTITRAKASTRRVLSDKAIAMSKLLNAFDILEEELMKVLAQGD
jgi:hypothetical protein